MPFAPNHDELLDRNQFRIGFNAQHEWAWLITAAFFLGKIGGGLFVISWFLDDRLGALVALILVAVGKTTAHLLFLGKPLRAWRAVVRWRTSWISRGVIAMGIFSAAAFVYVLPYLGVSALDGSLAVDIAGGVGLASGIVVMGYDGFVMRSAKGIPLWTSYLVPVLVVLYALLGGATVSLVVGLADEGRTAGEIEWMQVGFVAANLVLVAIYVITAQVRSAAARFAARILMRGLLGWAFLVGAVAIGLVGTLALASVSVATGSEVALAFAAVTDLGGHFLMFLAILKAGTYEPRRPLPSWRTASASLAS